MRHAIIFILTISLWSPPKALAEPYLIPGSDFQDSGWIGMAFAESQSGEFSHCTIMTRYDNQYELSFSITPWPSFAIYFPMYQGGQTVGSQFPIKIWIDDLEPIRGLARRVDEARAFLGMPLDQKLVEAFQSGWLMTVEVEGGWRQTYKLRGTRNAINGLKLCAANYWSYEEDNPPNFVPDSEPENDDDVAGTESSVADDAPDTAPKDEFSESTGTGFYVNAEGSVLTNAHVVEGCRAILVDGEPARLEASSEDFDLAILRVGDTVNDNHAVFSSEPASLNTEIIVGGYPYSGLLGGINVTRGSLTSLKGLGGDGITMQISAPIQPGNSGGPVINGRGEVIGVVVSSLNSGMIFEALGNIPQNINFAIYGNIAQLFLMQNGVSFDIGKNASDALSDESLGETISSYTAFIECKQ